MDRHPHRPMIPDLGMTAVAFGPLEAGLTRNGEGVAHDAKN